mmetsp:Transcript_27170/g.75935  ORF Transcript_27170/g.75935 Transcript_27170/m.75935 type:complete len:204 (+) Transcript_27170:1102-1713(+)
MHSSARDWQRVSGSDGSADLSMFTRMGMAPAMRMSLRLRTFCARNSRRRRASSTRSSPLGSQSSIMMSANSLFTRRSSSVSRSSSSSSQSSPIDSPVLSCLASRRGAANTAPMLSPLRRYWSWSSLTIVWPLCVTPIMSRPVVWAMVFFRSSTLRESTSTLNVSPHGCCVCGSMGVTLRFRPNTTPIASPFRRFLSCSSCLMI